MVPHRLYQYYFWLMNHWLQPWLRVVASTTTISAKGLSGLDSLVDFVELFDQFGI
jgi:hypothetical protein